MSDSIPEEVSNIAIALRNRQCGSDRLCINGHDCGCLRAISDAILAERERCAKIAEQPSFAADPAYERGIRHASAYIASAIRSSHE